MEAELSSSDGGGERWILKQDLAKLKAESRLLKKSLGESQVRERVCLGRAEKAEEHAALARSEYDQVVERVEGLEMAVHRRRDRATDEVLELRRKIAQLEVSERLAIARADKAAERVAIARSEMDRAMKQASESSEQLAAVMDELERQQVEAIKLSTANELLRARADRSYTAALSEQLQALEVEIAELRARKANNMAATRQLNLERQRNKVLNHQVKELRKTIQDNWGKDILEQADAGAELPRLCAEIKSLKAALADAEATSASWRKVAFPDKAMTSGHYNAAMRFMIMKLIGMANVSHTNVPIVIEIMSEYFGVQLPGRWRRVRTSAAGEFVRKWLTWRPCSATCENIR